MPAIILPPTEVIQTEVMAMLRATSARVFASNHSRWAICQRGGWSVFSKTRGLIATNVSSSLAHKMVGFTAF